MASSHGLYFIRDLTISATSTGLYDVNGNKLSSANIIGSGNYAYSKAIELSPKSIEHILTATCQGCTVEIKLELSPDGVNWCPCILASGSACEFECTAAVGDCTTQTVDVPVLQFARIRIGNAGSTGGSCNVLLNFTLN